MTTSSPKTYFLKKPFLEFIQKLLQQEMATSLENFFINPLQWLQNPRKITRDLLTKSFPPSKRPYMANRTPQSSSFTSHYKKFNFTQSHPLPFGPFVQTLPKKQLQMTNSNSHLKKKSL